MRCGPPALNPDLPSIGSLERSAITPPGRSRQLTAVPERKEAVAYKMKYAESLSFCPNAAKEMEVSANGVECDNRPRLFPRKG